ASLFGNAIISVCGHADPARLAVSFKEVATRRGIITSRGGKYFLKDAKEIDLNDMKQVIQVIEKEGLRNVPLNPDGGKSEATFGNALDDLTALSKKRADQVRRAVIEYAKSHGYQLDESQIKSVGL